MKIIKKGADPLDKKKLCTCPQCRTKIEYTMRETTGSPDPREPGSYIDCPVCKKMIWV